MIFSNLSITFPKLTNKCSNLSLSKCRQIQMSRLSCKVCAQKWPSFGFPHTRKARSDQGCHLAFFTSLACRCTYVKDFGLSVFFAKLLNHIPKCYVIDFCKELDMLQKHFDNKNGLLKYFRPFINISYLATLAFDDSAFPKGGFIVL